MTYEIVEIDEYSGRRTVIYSVLQHETGSTLFDLFINENLKNYKNEVSFILRRLQLINFKTGAREQFFKAREGKPGDGVCALYDDPDYKLRSYCIRYGTDTVIMGGGGPKPPDTKTWQNSKKLKKEMTIMIKLSEAITERIRSKDIELLDDGQLLGDLIFDIDDDE